MDTVKHDFEHQLLDLIGHAVSEATDCPQRLISSLARRLEESTISLDDVPPRALVSDQDGYARHQVAHCKDSGIVAYLLVWLAGQGTPIHDHGGAWGVVCCLVGRLSVTDYLERGCEPSNQTARLRPAASSELACGAGGATCSPEHGIHRVQNLGPDTAYSLHVYSGEIPTYRVFDPVAQRYETVVRES